MEDLNGSGAAEYMRDEDGFADLESIENTNVVLWLSTPIHHDPRLEDGYCRVEVDNDKGCPKGQWVGSALTMWTGFESSGFGQQAS